MDGDADRLGAGEQGFGACGLGGGCRHAQGGGQKQGERMRNLANLMMCSPNWLVGYLAEYARPGEIPCQREGQFARASSPISRILR